jgi:hypothetical protein
VAKEIQCQGATGLTLYALVFDYSGRVWNGSSFVTMANSIATYALALTESALPTQYTCDFPSGITAAGLYPVQVRKRAGGSPATTDSIVAQGEIAWSGSAVVVPVVADSAGRVTTNYGLHKNTAFANFEFPMVLSSDHVSPATGKTVSGFVSLDGAAEVALTNSVSEVGNGLYKVNLAAVDLNGSFVALRFTATSCDPTLIGLIMQS